LIRCVVFDFDGTLVRSDDIKRAGFFAVTRDLDPCGEEMTRVLAERPGDRHAVFRRFARAIPADAAKLVEAYTVYCRDEIAVAEEIPGAGAALATLSRLGLVLYVNSATPDEALGELLELRGVAGHFAAAYGSRRSKLANLGEIATLEGLAPGQIAVVGNGADDCVAARSLGCMYVAVGDGEHEMSDLSGLPERLCPVSVRA
jgi:phosphoglycolate phosphatase-like HAD superfamily hydrolase